MTNESDPDWSEVAVEALSARIHELSLQWHPTRNEGLCFDDLETHSNCIVWWQCPAGHEWPRSKSSRMRTPGCPFCTGKRVAIEDSLGARLPDIAAQWHPYLNEELTPFDVLPTSGRAALWLCSAGHELELVIKQHVAYPSCSYCRGDKASPENNLGVTHPDVASEWHPSKNGERTAFDVVAGARFSARWRCAHGHEWSTTVYKRTKIGTGCPDCAKQNRRRATGPLSITHPEVASEWDPSRNGDVGPDDVTYGAHFRASWQCLNGDEWDATVKNRTTGQTSCPYCSGRLASPRRNLAVFYPDVAAEWHPTRNGDLRPEQVPPHSNKKVSWLCTCGHEWKATVVNRTLFPRSGCPACAGKVLGPDNNLAAVDPQLAAQWHPTKNGDLTAQDVFPAEHTDRWWKCPAGHEWQASPNERRLLTDAHRRCV